MLSKYSDFEQSNNVTVITLFGPFCIRIVTLFSSNDLEHIIVSLSVCPSISHFVCISVLKLTLTVFGMQNPWINISILDTQRTYCFTKTSCEENYCPFPCSNKAT